jgi:hypothetical protein
MASVIVRPTPTAGPLIAAITGLCESKMRRVTRPPPSPLYGEPLSSACILRSCSLQVSAPRPRSAPAQNARPAPVTMTHLISSSASERSNASISSCAISEVKALSWSGRCSVMVRIPSATA